MTVSRELISPYSYVGMKGSFYVPVTALKMEEKIKMANDIINICVRFYNLGSVERMMKKNRTEPLITARHIAAYLIKEMTGMNDGDICKLFNRDRTTIIHSVSLINGYIKIGEPKDLLQDLKEIKMLL